MLPLCYIYKRYFFYITFFVIQLFAHAHIYTYTTDHNYKYRSDLIIFSYDRPMQLYSLLESIEQYITDLQEIHVIYRTSSLEFQQGYSIVQEKFPYVHYVQQSNTPESDFKLLTNNAIFNSPTPYVTFAVDDIIVTDYISLSDCIKTLESTRAYGFYLKMGLNLTYCYPLQSQQPLPKIQKISSDVYEWQLSQGLCDWGYPHTVDMTLYRKTEIKKDFMEMNYTTPNSLEALWSERVSPIMYRHALCYEQSKIVNIPLNIVQRNFPNRHMNFMTPQQLLEIFNQGLKIDIRPLNKLYNPSVHIDYIPEFIER